MILVTGGTGGIGSELLRLLSQAGIPARALVRDPQKTQKISGITWIAGDLSRPETLTGPGPAARRGQEIAGPVAVLESAAGRTAYKRLQFGAGA